MSMAIHLRKSFYGNWLGNTIGNRPGRVKGGDVEPDPVTFCTQASRCGPSAATVQDGAGGATTLRKRPLLAVTATCVYTVAR